MRARIRALAAAPPGPAQPRHPLRPPRTRDGPGRLRPYGRRRSGSSCACAPAVTRRARRVRTGCRVACAGWCRSGRRCASGRAAAYGRRRATSTTTGRGRTGATCACNTGPLCRRHHRVKQLLMTKTRRPPAVCGGPARPAGPGLSPCAAPAPAQPVRQPAPAPVDEHDLSPARARRAARRARHRPGAVRPARPRDRTRRHRPHRRRPARRRRRLGPRPRRPLPLDRLTCSRTHRHGHRGRAVADTPVASVRHDDRGHAGVSRRDHADREHSASLGSSTGDTDSNASATSTPPGAPAVITSGQPAAQP